MLRGLSQDGGRVIIVDFVDAIVTIIYEICVGYKKNATSLHGDRTTTVGDSKGIDRWGMPRGMFTPLNGLSYTR